MSLDFLRALAFSGELTSFFREDPLSLIERGANGIQLRFDDDFMRAAFEGARESSYEPITNWYQGRPVSTLVSLAIQEIWNGDRKAIFEHRRYSLGQWYERNNGEKRKSINILVDVADPKHPLFSEGPTQYEGYRIKYRAAGPIQPHYMCGDSIKVGATKGYGTICGFFRDTAGERTYALTCGHVGHRKGVSITSPERRKAIKLGKVDSLIVPTGRGPCNRYADPTANGVDAALIKIDPHVSIEAGSPRTVHPVAAISQGDLVEIRGRGGPKQAQVISATIWKQIDLFKTGTMYCCGDIFELGFREPVYFQTSLSRPGDSGAAVLRPGLPDEWFGMLIGGYGPTSYASYAAHIVDWATAEYPNLLSIP
ncbi:MULTISPECIES: hypothetical protein [Bradyrhizobium]|uniref:hypothetical protein n=1 Tax=Bradyrhizobium TaxID=374 RepID=UPI00293F6AD4|nr:hypothetical protein [Bradyrhizobium sp. NDS-1]WOH74559.1 hypothetical protein RX330_05415 [Bradyrhizobium sp. NDS-1]